MNDETIVPFSMRPRDAAKALGISMRTIYAWEKAGLIKATRVGSGIRKTVLFPTAELQRLLKGQPASETKAR